MIDPIAVGEPKEFVVKEDLKSKSPTTWFIGALDSIEKQRILSSNLIVSTDDKGSPTVETVEKENEILNDFAIVKYGLKGWKNFGTLEFRTEKVKLFDREIDAVPDDLLRRIPLFIIYQLSTEIWGENKVDENLEKN